MATKSTAAKTTALATVVDPIAAVRIAREGEFSFPKAEQALPAPIARVSRERFSEDEQLISFIAANQWNDLKTQKILDSLRAQGRACGMSRLNKLLNRDRLGNPLPAEAEKAE